MSGCVLIRSAALPILVQDQGRNGYADIGVPVSGAFDATAAGLAQRLVGNPASAAALEITMGAVVLQTDTAVTVAVCGAAVEIEVAGRPIAVNEVASWPAGAILRLRAVRTGVRNYLAVRGGFDVATVLGSAASDTLSGLGPAPLHAGDRIGLARAPAGIPHVDHVPPSNLPAGALRLWLGPRHAWFTGSAVAVLGGEPFTVSGDINRIGLRLHGPVLHRSRTGELPSEPLQRGALQVPPDGQPIIMGPDHPTTGGYPVIATLHSQDWDALAQLRPGDRLRFIILDP